MTLIFVFIVAGLVLTIVDYFHRKKFQDTVVMLLVFLLLVVVSLSYYILNIVK